MFRICEENSVDNPGIFSLLLNGVYTRVSAPHLTPPARGLGVHKELGGDTAWTADPTDQRNIPDHMASWSVCRARGRRRKGELQEQEHLSLQVTVTQNGALMPWKWMDTCLSQQSCEWIIVLLSLLNCLDLSPQVLTFTPDSLPHPAGSKWLYGA